MTTLLDVLFPQLSMQLNRMEQTLTRIEQKVDQMAAVQVDQSVLDSIGAELSNIADAVTALVEDQSNPLTDADLTSITDPLSRIEDALPHADQEPVEPS